MITALTASLLIGIVAYSVSRVLLRTAEPAGGGTYQVLSYDDAFPPSEVLLRYTVDPLLRRWPRGPLNDLFGCHWCLSFWVSVAITAVLIFPLAVSIPVPAAVPFAARVVAGLLARIDDRLA